MNSVTVFSSLIKERVLIALYRKRYMDFEQWFYLLENEKKKHKQNKTSN